MIKLDEAALQRIQNEWLEKGSSLAKELGVSTGTLSRAASKLGLQRRKKPSVVTEEQIEIIRDLYKEKGSLELSKILPISRSTIEKIASNLKITTNAGYVAQGKQRELNNKSVNIYYFHQWSSDMAYILGFIFADGSINQELTQLSFGNSQKDLDIIQAIKTKLDSKHKLTLYPAEVRGGINSGPYVKFYVCSMIMMRQLVALGVYPAKCYRNDPVPTIPSEYQRDFVRGFFDGDGILTITSRQRGSLGFCGTQQFMTDIQEIVCSGTLLRKTPISSKKACPALYYCYWQRDADFEILYNYMYKDPNCLCGKRKKEKLERLIELRKDSISKRK